MTTVGVRQRERIPFRCCLGRRQQPQPVRSCHLANRFLSYRSGRESLSLFRFRGSDLHKLFRGSHCRWHSVRFGSQSWLHTAPQRFRTWISDPFCAETLPLFLSIAQGCSAANSLLNNTENNTSLPEFCFRMGNR